MAETTDCSRLSQSDWDIYLEADVLVAEAANDPENEPFKSRYAAVEKLGVLKENIERLIDLGSDLFYELRAAKAMVLYKTAVQHAATEERPRAEKVCMEALSVLEIDRKILDESILKAEFALLPVCIGVLINLLNQLGFLFEWWEDHEKAKYWLKFAEDAYSYYKIKYTDEAPLTPNALMQKICNIKQCDTTADDETEKRWKNFESTHTYTVYFLAQVYQNCGEKTLAANYCGRTLVRQLEANEFEPLEWALNAAMLGQYYTDEATVNNDNFRNARHCLAAATAVLRNQSTEITTDSSNATAEQESYQQTDADVARCWMHYCLRLLTLSKESYYSADDENTETDQKPPVDLSEIEPTLDAGISDIAPMFPALELNKLENDVPCENLTNFDSAKEVFLYGQKCVDKATRFYTLNEHCTCYVALLQYHSQLYKVLTAFEHQTDRKCKMHKRRVDMLSSVLKELSPTIYQQVCRQLLFEIGETYNEMVTLKWELLEESGHVETPSLQQMTKINTLVFNGMSQFQQFLDTYKKSDNTEPSKYQNDSVRPVILCHFYIGRLASKVIAVDAQSRIRSLERSLVEYKWIVDYCENRDSMGLELCKSEYDVCKEMANLLPVRIESLRSQL